MKQCPTCTTSYADDTLRFCLEDGTPLVDTPEQETVVRLGERESYDTEILPANKTTPGGGSTRVDIPGASHGSTTPITVQTSGGGGFPWGKLVIALLAVGVIAVVGAGLLGVAFYVGSRNNAGVATPTPQATPTPDDEKKRLEDEVAKLKKKVEETSGTNSNDSDSGDFSDIPNFGGTAEVNSPKDGFLALRNLPNVQFGNMIAKIPHGTVISILVCSDDTVTIDTRSGHWCMVSYQEQVGWVFDAWLNKNPKS